MDVPKTLDEEMRLRGFSLRTRDAYLRWNAAFMHCAGTQPKTDKDPLLRDFLQELEFFKQGFFFTEGPTPPKLYKCG